jgi:uncharacterized protein (TIGR00162 family)
MIVTSFSDSPQLNDPVLVEALPGIGFVASIAGLHLIREIQANRFCIFHSSSFQPLALTTDDGEVRAPINELYFAKTGTGKDLIILYGNSQALTVEGQYELSSKTLDISESLGCRSIVTVGGLKREPPLDSPKIFCTATDKQTLEEALLLGASTIQGRVYGAAGLLLGLGRLRGMRGCCILVETLGLYPDVLAARVALDFMSRLLGLALDVSRLDRAVEAIQKLLGGPSHEFGLKRE